MGKRPRLRGDQAAAALAIGPTLKLTSSIPTMAGIFLDAGKNWPAPSLSPGAVVFSKRTRKPNSVQAVPQLTFLEATRSSGFFLEKKPPFAVSKKARKLWSRPYAVIPLGAASPRALISDLPGGFGN
jgi:hypothetical protein